MVVPVKAHKTQNIKTQKNMQLKKNPQASLEDKKLTYVLMGLVLVLSICYVAFEWTQHERKVLDIEPVFSAAFEEDMIPITQQKEIVAPPPAAAPAPRLRGGNPRSADPHRTYSLAPKELCPHSCEVYRDIRGFQAHSSHCVS